MVMHKAIDGSVVDALLALECAAETLTEKRAEYDREVIAMETRWSANRARNEGEYLGAMFTAEQIAAWKARNITFTPTIGFIREESSGLIHIQDVAA